MPREAGARAPDDSEQPLVGSGDKFRPVQELDALTHRASLWLLVLFFKRGNRCEMTEWREGVWTLRGTSCGKMALKCETVVMEDCA